MSARDLEETIHNKIPPPDDASQEAMDKAMQEKCKDCFAAKGITAPAPAIMANPITVPAPATEQKPHGGPVQHLIQKLQEAKAAREAEVAKEKEEAAAPAEQTPSNPLAAMVAKMKAEKAKREKAQANAAAPKELRRKLEIDEKSWGLPLVKVEKKPAAAAAPVVEHPGKKADSHALAGMILEKQSEEGPRIRRVTVASDDDAAVELYSDFEVDEPAEHSRTPLALGAILAAASFAAVTLMVTRRGRHAAYATHDHLDLQLYPEVEIE